MNGTRRETCLRYGVLLLACVAAAWLVLSRGQPSGWESAVPSLDLDGSTERDRALERPRGEEQGRTSRRSALSAEAPQTRIRVVGQRREPLAEADLYVTARPARAVARSAATVLASSDAQGWLSIPAELAVRDGDALVVARREYLPRYVTRAELVDGGEIVLERGAVLRLRFVTESGAAAGGVRARASARSMPEWCEVTGGGEDESFLPGPSAAHRVASGTSGPDGRLTLQGLASGRVGVQLDGFGWSYAEIPPEIVLPDEREHALVVAELHGVAFRVTGDELVQWSFADGSPAHVGFGGGRTVEAQRALIRRWPDAECYATLLPMLLVPHGSAFPGELPDSFEGASVALDFFCARSGWVRVDADFRSLATLEEPQTFDLSGTPADDSLGELELSFQSPDGSLCELPGIQVKREPEGKRLDVGFPAFLLDQHAPADGGLTVLWKKRARLRLPAGRYAVWSPDALIRSQFPEDLRVEVFPGATTRAVVELKRNLVPVLFEAVDGTGRLLHGCWTSYRLTVDDGRTFTVSSGLPTDRARWLPEGSLHAEIRCSDAGETVSYSGWVLRGEEEPLVIRIELPTRH